MRAFWCFISYRHADNKELGRQWATWLHQAIETYEVPADLVGTQNERGETIPERIFPVFRDEEELPVDADLASPIYRALDESKYLLVICSPRAVESSYVASEIRYFKQLGREDRVLAAMIEGEPNASWDAGKQAHGIDPSRECFPEPLRQRVDAEGHLLEERTEPIAADFRLDDGSQGWTSPEAYRQALSADATLTAQGRSAAVEAYRKKCELMKLKIIAGILGVALGVLTKRDAAHQLALAQKRARVRNAVLAVVSVLAVAAVASAWFAFSQKQEADQQREVAVAQKLEAQRERAEAMNQKREADRQRHETQVTLSRSDDGTALARIDKGEDAEAVAYLCRALRSDPDNRAAAALLNSLLRMRAWTVPRFQFTPPSGSITALDPGGRFAVVSDDQKQQLWDLDAGREVRDVPPVDFFTPDGQSLIVSIGRGEARLNTSGGSPVPLGANGEQSSFNPNYNPPFRFSPDGRAIALHDESRNQIQGWTLADNQPIGNPLDDKAADGLLAESADASRVLAGGDCDFWDKSGALVAHLFPEGPVRVWDTTTGAAISPPLVDAGDSRFGVETARFSPDGKWVAGLAESSPQSNAHDVLDIWDSATGEKKFSELGGSVADWSPDNRLLLTAGQDVLTIRDGATFVSLAAPLLLPDKILDAWFAPDGGRVVAVTVDSTGGDLSAEAGLHDYTLRPTGPKRSTFYPTKEVFAWNGAPSVPAAETLPGTRPWVLDAVFSPDGKLLVTTTGNTAQVWDVAKRQIQLNLTMASVPVCAVFSPDGTRLLVISEDGAARIWDATSGQIVTDICDHAEIDYAEQHPTRSVTSIGFAPPPHPPARRYAGAFSPDGKSVAVAAGFSARLWDAATGRPLMRAWRQGDWVSSVGFSPDGKNLLVSSQDGNATVWSTATGKSQMEPMQVGNATEQAAFSPDGGSIGTAVGESLQVRSARDGSRISTIHPGGSVDCFAFSADGQSALILAGGRARVWNCATGAALSAPMVLGSALTAASFSRDGKNVIAGAQDGMVRVWDAASGLPVSVTMKGGGAINAALFSPDGGTMAAAADDGTVTLWPFGDSTPPSWLLDFAEILAGCTLDANGNPAARIGAPSRALREAARNDAHRSDELVTWARGLLEVER